MAKANKTKGNTKGKTKQEITDLSDIVLTQFVVPKGGHYEQNQKILCISFMDAMQREFNGKLVPNFSEVNRVTGVPITTLSNWWDMRDKILRLHDVYLAALPKMLGIRLGQEALAIVEAISSKGYEDVPIRDLTNLFSQFVQKMRLLSGQSTDNIAHNHSYTPVLRSPGPGAAVSTSDKEKATDAVIISEQVNNDTKQ